MPRATSLPHCDILRRWGVSEMAQWLKECGFADAVPGFKEQNIDGQKFIYLSEIQVFQMKNISIKSRNGIKEAQKNIQGRDAAKKKAIMNVERPPQVPGRDYNYKHHTPAADDDDDGWGSDFSDDPQDYVEPLAEQELYEDPAQNSDDTENYIEPLPKQPVIPGRRLPPPEPNNSSLPHPPRSRGLPILPASGGPPPLPPGRKHLPPEPQDPEEDYIEPNPSHHQDHQEQEVYEEPDTFSPNPPPRVPRNYGIGNGRKVSPPPQRVPPHHEEPEEHYELDEPEAPEENYEEPALNIAAMKPPSLPSRQDHNKKIMTGAINVMPSGPVKPSDLKPKKNGASPYQPPKLVTPNISKPTWADEGSGGSLKPSDLKKKQGIMNNTPTGRIHNRDEERVNSTVPNIPVSPGRPFPKTPVPKTPADEKTEGLYSYTWYHSDMPREVASGKLLNRNKNGMFLVRKSTKAGSPYALSLIYGGRVYNLNIRLRPDNKYALGIEKPDEKVFKHVPDLISYFQSNTLVLGGDSSSQTTLKQALPK